MIRQTSATLVLILCVLPGCTGRDSAVTPRAATPVTVGAHGILHRYSPVTEKSVEPSPPELKKKEVAERLDSHGLLYTGKVVVDRDPSMLVPPEAVAGLCGKEYVVAKEPPEIEFAVIPVEPPFLGESPVKVTKDVSNYTGPWKIAEITNTPGPWTHFSQGAYDPATGRFYTSVGDHAKYGAHIRIVEFVPSAKTVRCLPEVNRAIGRTDRQFSEGKIHGWLDFYKSGQLDRKHLWFCTYWSKYPEPDEEDFETGYRGGHIVSLDVANGDIVDYGVPVTRAAWPYHRIDTKRGILYAVGMYGEFLSWDIGRQTTRWAGYLPPGMSWWNRAIMIDEVTGMVYTTNMDESDTLRHFIRYDPDRNRFSMLDCHVPPESGDAIRGDGKGNFGNMRAQTRHRGPDGLFWCITYGGELFSFDPEKEEIVDRGTCWPHVQRYTCAMDRSPGGRYVYYVPCSPRFYYTVASPVIQYDTRTGTKKVLAFMFPYYRDKYGFTASQAFSVRLDDRGERLFVTWNGGFIDRGVDGVDDTFGQVAVTVVNIPAGERVE